MSLIDPGLAEVIVCPVEHGELRQDIPASRLECVECGRRYPVEDGIAILLIERAEGGPDD